MEMIQINLLPKEFRRRSSGLSLGKNEYYGLAAAAAVVFMLAGVSFYQTKRINELNDEMEKATRMTQQLQKDIALVDALTDVKEKITQRLGAIDRLDQHRTTWVRILEDMSQRVPEFSWLSQIRETSAGNQPGGAKKNASVSVASDQIQTIPMNIEGFSFTLNALANFMINLMRSNYFSDVELVSVDEMNFQEQKAYSYKLTATLHYLSDEELKKLLEKESGPNLLASF